jgi:phosphatidylserine decarboxylase
MRRLLRTLGLAEYGGDELLIAALACGAMAWALWLGLGPWAALVAAVPWAIVVWFFRDPERRVPERADALLAPADGRIQDIQEVDAPAYMGGRALRVGIFLSPLDVHVNRAPCEGTVEHLRYLAGEFLPAYNPKAPERNEAVELGLSTPEGMKVLVKQITGVLARRIVCAARPGSRLAQGARYGMIKFGSRTEIYVPLDAGFQPAIKIGDRVRGGETVVLEHAGRSTRGNSGAEVREDHP